MSTRPPLTQVTKLHSHTAAVPAPKNRYPLLHLPKEILFKIIEAIGFEDINEDVKAVTRLAVTSKRVLILVEAAAGCTLKALVSPERRFGKPQFNPDNVIEAVSQRKNLRGKYPNITDSNAAPDLSYLDLNGSFSWLPPLRRKSEERMEPHRLGRAIAPKDLDQLIAKAKRLNLKLPTSFLTLMRSSDLQYRIPSSCAAYFTVPPDFVKCPPKLDRNAGDYILRFISDQQGCWYANLYLDVMGQHRVLFADLDPHSIENDIQEDGSATGAVSSVEHAFGLPVAMETKDFEEYLYHTWTNELFYFDEPMEEGS